MSGSQEKSKFVEGMFSFRIGDNIIADIIKSETDHYIVNLELPNYSSYDEWTSGINPNIFIKEIVYDAFAKPQKKYGPKVSWVATYFSPRYLPWKNSDYDPKDRANPLRGEKGQGEFIFAEDYYRVSRDQGGKRRTNDKFINSAYRHERVIDMKKRYSEENPDKIGLYLSRRQETLSSLYIETANYKDFNHRGNYKNRFTKIEVRSYIRPQINKANIKWEFGLGIENRPITLVGKELRKNVYFLQLNIDASKVSTVTYKQEKMIEVDLAKVLKSIDNYLSKPYRYINATANIRYPVTQDLHTDNLDLIRDIDAVNRAQIVVFGKDEVKWPETKTYSYLSAKKSIAFGLNEPGIVKLDLKYRAFGSVKPFNRTVFLRTKFTDLEKLNKVAADLSSSTR